MNTNKNNVEDSNETLGTLPDLIVLPELEDLLPALSPEERSELRQSIEKEGIRDRLLVWKTRSVQKTVHEGKEVRILIDGHNRYRTAEALGMPLDSLPFAEVAFADLEEAKAWIIANQLMRRNLTDEQRSYFRGMVYEASKKSPGGNGSNQHMKEERGQNEPVAKRTTEKVAEQFTVSASTIKRDAAFAKQVNALSPEDKAAVLAGKKKLPTDKPNRKSVKPNRATTKPNKTVTKPNQEAEQGAFEETDRAELEEANKIADNTIRIMSATPGTSGSTEGAETNLVSLDSLMGRMVQKTMTSQISGIMDSAIRIVSTAPCSLSPEEARNLTEAIGLEKLRDAITDKIPEADRAKATPEALSDCTVADLSRLTFSTPREIGLAIYRVIDKAQGYIGSGPSLSKTERDGLVMSLRELQKMFDKLPEAVEDLPLHCPEGEQTDITNF